MHPAGQHVPLLAQRGYETDLGGDTSGWLPPIDTLGSVKGSMISGAHSWGSTHPPYYGCYGANLLHNNHNNFCAGPFISGNDDTDNSVFGDGYNHRNFRIPIVRPIAQTTVTQVPDPFARNKEAQSKCFVPLPRKPVQVPAELNRGVSEDEMMHGIRVPVVHSSVTTNELPTASVIHNVHPVFDEGERTIQTDDTSLSPEANFIQPGTALSVLTYCDLLLEREAANAINSSADNERNRKTDINVEAGLARTAPFIFPQSQVSLSSATLGESTEDQIKTNLVSYFPAFVKENLKFWYKPKISRDNAIRILRNLSNGSFIIRDSIGFPGAFGLALKVAKPPPHVVIKPGDDVGNELVRHYLIEPTENGVRLKGCTNEPTYSNLSALVYHHSLEAIALPCKLIIPEVDFEFAAESSNGNNGTRDLSSVDRTAHISNQTVDSSSTCRIPSKALLERGAACHVIYMLTTEIDGSAKESPLDGCKRAIDEFYQNCTQHNFNLHPTIVHFRVSAKGITLTDVNKRLFFRRHYAVESVLCAAVDPDKTRYFTVRRFDDIKMLDNPRCFGFVTKTMKQQTYNLEVHLFIEYDSRQPAGAVVNFVNKVMLSK